MKKVIKSLLKLAVVVGIFTGGYLTNELTKNKSAKLETTVHAEQKETRNISTIPTNKDNIFSQYFTITNVNAKGATAKNTYYDKDVISIDQEYISSLKLEAGTMVIVTWNHDDIINVEYDLRNITTYNIIDSKEYGIDIDNDKYVFGVNPYDSADFTTIDKKDYRIGDIVEVTFQNDFSEIQSDKKIGQWKQDEPKIVEKVVEKPVYIEKESKQPQAAKQMDIKKEETVSSNEIKKNEVVQNVNETKNDNEPTNKPETQNNATNDNKQEYKFEEKSDSYVNSVRQYIITENTTDKLIHAVNVNNDQEKVLLENDNYKEGDTIEVTYGASGYHDDIVKCIKLNK